MTHDNNALAQQFEHWFFKYLGDDQRKELFRLTCGQGVADEANNHSHQRIVLKRILATLRSTPASASDEVGERIGWLRHTARDMRRNFDSEHDHWANGLDKAADMIERLAVVSHETGSDDTQAALRNVNETQQPEDQVERVRHKKRETTYTIVGKAELQMSFDDLCDGAEMIVYRGDNGHLWVRNANEFWDGRFESLPAIIKSQENNQ